MGYAGLGDIGFEGYGNGAGGYFQDRNGSGYAYVGNDHVGIRASGSSCGGFFEDPDPDGGGYAYVGIDQIGIEAYATGAGGFFRDFSGSYAYVGYAIWKVQGTGTVSFVQNHPTQEDRVIVYAAPEGDEVAVYTRGSGRLVDGEARVALGGTFALVANPDVGLTAYLTPRGESPVALTVAALSTNQLIIRGPTGAEVDFDYIVYGLRIGFEAMPVVQVKRDEAYLPTTATLAELEAGQTDTVASSALARFGATQERLTGAAPDLSRTNALAARINAGREEWLAAQAAREQARRPWPIPTRDFGDVAPVPPTTRPAPVIETAKSARIPEVGAKSERPAGTTLILTAAQATELGAVVSLDPLHPGAFVESAGPGEALIVGCTLGNGPGEIEIATAGVALCRVDASSARIEVGDLLIASSLPGHAAKHDGTAPAVAVVGRAVDPLPFGTGLIRVLLGGR